MAEPLHLPDSQEPARETIRLGDQVIETDPQTAGAVRNAFETLAAQYGAALEDYQRRMLSQIGTQQQPPQYYGPPQPDVPDPDLLFSNKQAWTDQFAGSLQQQLGSVRGETAQLVQGAVNAFQQELQRRDLAQAAQAKHDAAMEEMLERRGLSEHTRVVQAIYNEQYDKLKHLPLELGLDKIGQLAGEEIDRIRSGEKWTINRGPEQGVAPKPPPVLRSARRAAPAPAPAPSDSLAQPQGELGMMGRIIRERQAKLLARA